MHRGGHARVAVAARTALTLALLAGTAHARAPSGPRALSPFFPALEQLCVPPYVTNARADVQAYCADKAQVPAFAAGREDARLATLDEQRTAAGLNSARLLRIPPLAPVRALIDLVPLAPDAKPPGELTLNAIALAIDVACAPQPVAGVLPNTCTVSRRPPFTLASLRAALVNDAAMLAARGLRELQRVPKLQAAVETLDLIAGISNGDDIPDLLARTDALVEGRVTDASGAPVVGAASAVATEIVVRLLRDGPVFDKPQAHYERVVAEVLSERVRVGDRGLLHGFSDRPVFGFAPDSKPEPASLSPRQSAATSRLIAAIGGLEQARRSVNDGAKEQDVATIVTLMFDVVEAARTIVSDAESPAPPAEVRKAVARVVAAAATGNVRVLATLLDEEIEDFEKRGVLSPNAACGSRSVLGVAFAETDAERRRKLATCVVELPQWTDKLLFAAHAGLPVFSSTSTRIDGDLLLGYNGDAFGISGFGSVYNYDVTDASGRTETFRAEGSGDLWGSLKVGTRLRLEGRLSGGGALYNSDVYPAARGYFEETSLMGRGTALVGVRLVPNDRLVVAAHAGGGFQVEVWDGTQVVVAGRRVVLTEEIPVTARAVARLRGQWTAWPGVLSFRVSGDFDYLSITKAKEVSSVGPGGLTTTISETGVRQAELFARAYADVDRLELVGFRPVVHGGANVVNVDSQTAVIPVFGVGIRRESF